MMRGTHLTINYVYLLQNLKALHPGYITITYQLSCTQLFLSEVSAELNVFHKTPRNRIMKLMNVINISFPITRPDVMIHTIHIGGNGEM